MQVNNSVMKNVEIVGEAAYMQTKAFMRAQSCNSLEDCAGNASCFGA